MGRTKNRFTFKIGISYLILCLLAMVSGYFMYSEIQILTNNELQKENNAKLLKTGSLTTQLYEAESLSKLALQTKNKQNFRAYALKIDSIFIEIDTLKGLTSNPDQKAKLDSVKILLKKKRINSEELFNLKIRNDNNRSIDNALTEFKKLEASFGKLSITDFEKNPERLSPYQRRVLEDWVAYLNKNIPSDPGVLPDAEKIDSILNTSKTLLAQAKTQDSVAQRFLSKKENQVNRTAIELSQQLRNIIHTFEREIVVDTYNQNIKKETAMRRSMRMAVIASLLGFIIVCVFTFLINRDFWKVQNYRKKLEREKKHSEWLLKSREQLISTVSHDLRTPLNTIQGYTELMANATLTSKQKGYLEKVKSTTNYITNLINDLLDFSKLEAGRLKLYKSTFVPGNLIRETADNLRALFEYKSLHFYVEIDPALENRVKGDPVRLRQILINLIGNAFKFTEEGAINIIAKALKDNKDGITAQISITDTGIGIAQDKQQLIFKEFVQAEAKTEKEFGGHGLGLTISKKLSELLKGSLTLESRLGKGSTFTLKLPLEKSSEEALSVQEKNIYTKNDIRILIIDDDTALLAMLRELMNSMGIKTSTFSSFPSIKKNTPLKYDVVLTDIQMPEITGFEVMKELKSKDYVHYMGQPIVAMTGKTNLAIDHYISKGFASVLQKPFAKNELISVLNAIGIHLPMTPFETSSSKTSEPSLSYSLDTIRSFFGNSEEDIKSVLRAFLRDTQQNLQLLNNAYKMENFNQIRHITHRMLPMFRQLCAKKCVPILELLETGDLHKMGHDKVILQLRELKTEIYKLTVEMESHLATHPNHSN